MGLTGLLSVNLQRGRPLISMLVCVGWCSEWRGEEGLTFHSCIPLPSLRPNPSLPGTPNGIPPSVFFIHALLHPFIPSQSPSAANSPPQEKGCREDLPSYPSGGGDGESVGVFFHPFSLMWLYSGSVYSSVTTSLSCKPNSSSSVFIIPSIFPLYPFILLLTDP